MIPIRKAEVEDLLKNEHSPCLTLVLSPGVKEQGLPVTMAAYRALIREAEKNLGKYHLGQIETEALLKPLRNLENDTLFWQQHQHSLLFYRSAGTFFVEHRNARWESKAIVDDRFHIRYLVADLDEHFEYHVLVVAKNKAELYNGSKDAIELNPKAKLTQSIKDITEPAENMRLQVHSATSGSHRGSGSNAFYSGAGEDNDEVRQDQLRYLKHLDTEVMSALGASRNPLLLVGVEETMARFRKISAYPNILEDILRYNDEYADAAKLKKDGLAIILQHRTDAKENVLRKIKEETDRPEGKVVTGFNDLLRLSQEGRVDTLFIAVDQQSLRGYFDPVKLEVIEDENGEDLSERLIRTVIEQGANCYNGQETLAYLRY
jgi:hypothetical protein